MGDDVFELLRLGQGGSEQTPLGQATRGYSHHSNPTNISRVISVLLLRSAITSGFTKTTRILQLFFTKSSTYSAISLFFFCPKTAPSIAMKTYGLSVGK